MSKESRILKVPPKYTKGTFTQEEKVANRKRYMWEWRQSLKAKGWKSRNFYYPKEYDDLICDLVMKCRAEWDEKNKPDDLKHLGNDDTD